MPLCLNNNLEESSRTQSSPRVRLRTQSQLHCGSSTPTQFCPPHFHTRVSPKTTRQLVFYMQPSPSLFQDTQLKILQLSTLLKSRRVNCQTSYFQHLSLPACFLQNQGQQFNHFIYKLSCDVVLRKPEGKLNSKSSLRHGSNVPQFRVLSPNSSRRLGTPLCDLPALVQATIITALIEHYKHLSTCLFFFPVGTPPPGLTEGLEQKKMFSGNV